MYNLTLVIVVAIVGFIFGCMIAATASAFRNKPKENKHMDRTQLFVDVLGKIHDGMEITFTEKNVAEGDDFLIFNEPDDKVTVKFHTSKVPFMVEFDNDEPMRLEDCPTSFFRSILLNVK